MKCGPCSGSGKCHSIFDFCNHDPECEGLGVCDNCNGTGEVMDYDNLKDRLGDVKLQTSEVIWTDYHLSEHNIGVIMRVVSQWLKDGNYEPEVWLGFATTRLLCEELQVRLRMTDHDGAQIISAGLGLLQHDPNVPKEILDYRTVDPH